MNKHLLNRRQVGARCAALGLSLPAASAMLAGQANAQVPGTGAASQPAGRTVKFPDGRIVTALGQGSWHLGQSRHPAAEEEEALRTGISLGMTLIDTAGDYGNGRSEELIGRAIAGQRDHVFLVSKVGINDVYGDGIARICEASLARLGTDHLDLFLLWEPVRSNILPGVVANFEKLRTAGKIRAWGVSNFNVDQMEALFLVPDGNRCATNQIAYSLNNQRLARDVLPWCAKHNMPMMAYSPLGGDDNLLVNDPRLTKIASEHGCTAAAVALGWAIRSGNVIAIPESGSPAHVKDNAVALSIDWIPASP